MGNVGRKKWKFILKLQITEPINLTIISGNIYLEPAIMYIHSYESTS